MHRGGRTGPHRDGWGITFYEDKGFRTFKDPMPCYESPIARLVQDYPIKSRAVIGHIRQANRGHVALENTHPFTREQWGRFWTFAHNGQLSGYEKLLKPGEAPAGRRHRHETAFCWLLNELERKYPRKPADMKALFLYAGELCGRLNISASSICCCRTGAIFWPIAAQACTGSRGARHSAKRGSSTRMS